MLVKPALKDLMTDVDSRYTLVTLSAQRARAIMQEQDNMHENAVSVALAEIADNKVEWEKVETTDDGEDVVIED